MYSKPRRDDGVAAWVSHPFIHEAETQKDVRCIFAGFVLNVVSKPLNWPSKISLLVLHTATQRNPQASEFHNTLNSPILVRKINFRICPFNKG